MTLTLSIFRLANEAGWDELRITFYFDRIILLNLVLLPSGGNPICQQSPAENRAIDESLLSWRTVNKTLFLFLVFLVGCSRSYAEEMIDSYGVTMRLVPAGEIIMGSDTDSDSHNSAHAVDLDAFYMDVYEITNAQYEACVMTGVCERPHYDRTDFRPSYYGNPEYDNYPVIYVNWTMAKTFCEWRGARLPTEAEWEKTARGTDGSSYPWGEGISCDVANYDGDPAPASFCAGDTSEVGGHENGKSPYGMYDMAGNVFEWMSSLYQPYPYDASDRREDLTRGGNRVIRGGAWSEGPDAQRVFYRSWIGPEHSESAIGFRCAKDAES